MKSTFAYAGIRVKNMEESVKFYTELFGMKETGRSRLEATGGDVVTLASEKGSFELELNFYPEGNEYATEYSVGEGLDHLAFKVEDIDKALDEAAKAGHPTVLEVKSATSRWAYITDPNGIWIELIS